MSQAAELGVLPNPTNRYPRVAPTSHYIICKGKRRVDHEITGTIIADIAQLTQDTRHVDTAARRRALTVTTPT